MATERVEYDGILLSADKSGFPVMIELAAVPDAGVTNPDPDAKSGNPNHDVRSGRFGAGSTTARKPQETNAPPQGVDAQEWARRLDTVREAAREFDQLLPADLAEWLKGKTTREMSADEVQAFFEDVRAQQLDDLVDILDYKSRTTGRGRRFVKVTAPRGYTKRTLGSLTDDEIRSLDDRLRARGWSDEDIDRDLFKKLSEERKAVLRPDEDREDDDGEGS